MVKEVPQGAGSQHVSPYTPAAPGAIEILSGLLKGQLKLLQTVTTNHGRKTYGKLPYHYKTVCVFGLL